MRKMYLLIFISLLALQVVSGERSSKSEDLNYFVNTLDSEIEDVIWCGNSTLNDNNVIALTIDGTIYRSQNKMIHFENIIETLIKVGITHLADNNSNVGEVIKMIRSTSNPNIIILQGNGQVNWITRDCGNTFRAFSKNKEKIKIIKMHPTQESWMLASTDNQCSNKQGAPPCFSFSILWLSEDSGITWVKLINYIYKFDWGFFGTNEHSQVPVKRIYWVSEIGNKQNQNRYGLKSSRHFFYSDDFLITKIRVLDQGNVFYIDKNYLLVVQLEDESNQLIQLKVADPKRKEVKLRDIQLGEKLKNHKFTLLDTNEGQVFINVNHLGKTSPMGTLYISDATGIRFSQSLLGHLRTEKGETDFERLHGIYGVYIANVYDKERREQFEQTYSGQSTEEQEDENPQNKKSNTSVKNNKKTVTMKELITQKVQTMITFDKGGIWDRITAPTQDENGQAIKCEKNCYLNIHSSSNDLFNSFYSSKSAIGIVLANGNVGQYLSHQTSQVNTYLSRDAGLTWSQIKKGAYIFEIGDHGSIIVMAKDKDYGTTKYIEYSFDEGLTWNQLKIYDKELKVDNIITEPSNISTTFMVLAQTVASTEKEEVGMAITIDFSPMLTRNCSGAADPDTLNSDYEKWVPHGYKSQKCLLGASITYSRRKRESICLNGESFERIIDAQICQCTEEDWECDYGYSRQGDNPCIRDSNLTDEEYEGNVPEICIDFYQVSRGYRKIPGNVCSGGVDHSADLRRCPGNEIISFHTIKNLFLIIAAIGAIYYGNKYRDQLGNVIQALSSFIPLSHNNRKDFIDFSKVKLDNDERDLMNMNSTGNKLMNLFKRDATQHRGGVNHYSNINDYDDEDNTNIKGEYNNQNQHQYFADSQYDHEYDNDDETHNFDPRV